LPTGAGAAAAAFDAAIDDSMAAQQQQKPEHSLQALLRLGARN
jgi:hypothetical protein